MIEPNVRIITPYWIPFQYNCLKPTPKIGVAHQRVSSGGSGMIYFDMFQPSQLIHVGCIVAHMFVVQKIRRTAHRTRLIPVLVNVTGQGGGRGASMTQPKVVSNFMHLIRHGTERLLAKKY
jgi:hypothetical protein